MNKKLLVFILLIFMCGCRTVDVDVNMLYSAVNATSKASRPISDEEEYYIGRAVSARIVATYPILDDRRLTEYINLAGQTIALHSDRPYTYGGYHFVVLDSKEINAFASPGGTIFITKGMIGSTKNEDELAAVLAHEIAHVNNRDGISAINKSRWTEALTIIGTEAAKKYGPQQLSQLVEVFEGSIDDIFKTLVVNGYGRSQEYGADRAALAYLSKAGYDSWALNGYLERMIREGRTTEGGITRTHPETKDRLDNISENAVSQKTDVKLFNKRSGRFSKILQ